MGILNNTTITIIIIIDLAFCALVVPFLYIAIVYFLKFYLNKGHVVKSLIIAAENIRNINIGPTLYSAIPFFLFFFFFI